MDKYEKVLVIFLILYFILLVYKLDYKNFIWDEISNIGPPIFWRDFIKYFLKNPTLNLNELKSYGIYYQSHHVFFSQMLYHPPFYKILVFLSMLLFGINGFAVRFPSLILGILGLFFTYLIGKEISGRKSIGLLSTVLLGLSPLYYQFSRLSTLDIPIAVVITITMYFLLKYLKYKRTEDSIFFGILFGISLLTKIFGIYIGLSLFLFIIFTKKYKLLKDAKVYISCFLAGLLFIPWVLISIFFPVILDIPFSTIEKYGYIGFNVKLINLLTFHIKQFSYVIGILVILGLFYLIKRRRDSDVFLISWILGSYLFPLLLISTSSTEFYRFTMPIMPALVISTSIFLNKIMGNNRIKNYRYILLACLLVFSLLLSINYNLRVNIRYPAEDAVLWVLQNTPKGGGVLYDDKGTQFYLMKHDRNLNIRAADCKSKEGLDTFLNQEYPKSEYEKLGVKNPKFYYIIVKEPLKQSNNRIEKIGKRDIYTREQSFFKDFFNYIKEDGGRFKLKKIFYGNKPNANVFVYEILGKKMK